MRFLCLNYQTDAAMYNGAIMYECAVDYNELAGTVKVLDDVSWSYDDETELLCKVKNA